MAFYGPYQHFWYRALDRAFTARTVGNFAAKVAMNQLCLAPVVISCVFAWNLALQGQAPLLRRKLEQDFVPTLVNGAPACALHVPGAAPCRAAEGGLSP